MSVATHVLPEADGLSDSHPSTRRVQATARPLGIPKAPVRAVPQSDDADEPATCPEESRRLLGARCRIAMEYLD